MKRLFDTKKANDMIVLIVEYTHLNHDKNVCWKDERKIEIERNILNPFLDFESHYTWLIRSVKNLESE
jgi:hypothetical protein